MIPLTRAVYFPKKNTYGNKYAPCSAGASRGALDVLLFWVATQARGLRDADSFFGGGSALAAEQVFQRKPCSGMLLRWLACFLLLF